MSSHVRPPSRIDAVALPQARDAARPRADFASSLQSQPAAGDAPQPVGPAPPPEARAMLDAAQEAIRRLHEQGRELHFEVHGDEVRIEVRDLEGRVLARIPPGEALDLLTGTRPLEQHP